MIEFQGFPKIARLNRDITITEKIDGTNGAVGIQIIEPDVIMRGETPRGIGTLVCVGDEEVYARQTYLIYAQSRKSLITPSTDNHGFARWVWDNAEALTLTLGPGLHFGEWWGAGINRGYGLPKGDKRFSLFNTKRWGWMNDPNPSWLPGLGVVPILYEGPFDPIAYQWADDWELPPWIIALKQLREYGSYAVPGFKRPEGVVVYHHAANMCFKITLERDEEPKSLRKEKLGLAA